MNNSNVSSNSASTGEYLGKDGFTIDFINNCQNAKERNTKERSTPNFEILTYYLL